MWTSCRCVPPRVTPTTPFPSSCATPFLELAAEIKKAGLDFLVSNVGGFFDPAEADQAIAEGKLDLVAMARAWISTPITASWCRRAVREDIIPLPAVQQVPWPGQA